MTLVAAKARLLGIRTIEQDDNHVIIHVPRYLRSQMADIAKSAAKDAEIMGRDVTVSLGDSIIRIDRNQKGREGR